MLKLFWGYLIKGKTFISSFQNSLGQAVVCLPRALKLKRWRKANFNYLSQKF